MTNNQKKNNPKFDTRCINSENWQKLKTFSAVTVACYVAHKATFIGEGIFAQIHQIRNANVTSVTEALNHLKGKERRVSARKQAQIDCEQLE